MAIRLNDMNHKELRKARGPSRLVTIVQNVTDLSTKYWYFITTSDTKQTTMLRASNPSARARASIYVIIFSLGV